MMINLIKNQFDSEIPPSFILHRDDDFSYFSTAYWIIMESILLAKAITYKITFMITHTKTVPELHRSTTKNTNVSKKNCNLF